MGSIQNEKVNLPAFPGTGMISRVLSWIARWHWLVIGLTAFLLLSFEFYDSLLTPIDYMHIIEFIVYLILLIVVGLLVDSLMLEIRVQTQTQKILDFKHKLSLEFSGYPDWDVLITQLARFPSTMARVEQIS